MQKKLIAVAVAGLVSGAAFAQANVTIYGAADATYDNVKAEGATSNAAGAATNYQSRGRTTMNSSFIGFKGAESMGNGLTAVFQFESGVGENGGATNLNAAGSTYGWANRDTFVALAGGFGTIAAGNLTGPARWIGAAMDPNAGATGIGANTALIGKLGGGSGASYFDNRFSNAIAYISPSMSGFQGVLAYVPNENRLTTATPAPATGANPTLDTSGWTLKALYNQGPILAAYSYTQVKDKGNGITLNTNSTLGAAAVIKAQNNRLAGKYDFGMGTAGLMWDQTKGDLGGSMGSATQSVFYIPVTFNAGNGKIIAQYGWSQKLKLDGTIGTLGIDQDAFKAQHVMVGYEYNLSKRTLVKALYSQITNKSNASYDFLYGVSAPNTTATGSGVAYGSDPKGLSIGMRHSF